MILFVYFDLGGVVILDFSGTDKWVQLKKELGITADRDRKFEDFWDKYEPEVNAGRDVETLLPLIKEKFGSNLPAGYSFLMDGFVNRFEANRSIWPVIEKIRKECGVGLLTNMYPRMLGAIKERSLMPDVKWGVVIDSSETGFSKPDFRIFELGEKKACARGKEIMLVDNSQTNIDAAKEFGWQTFLYDSLSPVESSAKLIDTFG